MKKSLLILSALCLCAGVAMAQQAKKPATHPSSMKASKTHEVSAEFVSLDAAKRTLTIKDEKGQVQTLPLGPSALTEAKTLTKGEKLMLTCRDNDKGEHQEVTHIQTKKP